MSKFINNSISIESESERSESSDDELADGFISETDDHLDSFRSGLSILADVVSKVIGETLINCDLSIDLERKRSKLNYANYYEKMKKRKEAFFKIF